MDAPQRPIALVHWPQLGSVLHSAWQARRNRGSLWLPIGLLSLVVLVPVVLWVVLPAERAARAVPIVTALLAVLASLTAWTMLAFNVLRQNHPHWAAVVPGHASALRQALLVAVVCISALSGLIGTWAGWPFIATALCVAATCAAVACAMRWWWLLPALAVVAPLAISAFTVELPAAVAWVWRDAPLAFTGFVVACVLLALRAVVFSGGAAHVRSQARLLAMGTSRQAIEARGRSQGGRGWLGASQVNRAYAACMRRVLARSESSIGARLALGAGPQAHWTGVFTNALLSLLLTLVLIAIIQSIPQWNLGRSIRGGLLMAVVMTSLTVPLGLPVAMWASRREQALLVLLPGAPRNAAFNRWLASRLAAMHLAVVVVLLLAVVLIGRAIEVDPAFSGMAEIALSALAISPLLTVLLWRDWARAKAPSGGLQASMFALTMSIFAVAATWVLWLERPWYQLAALAALALLPLAAWQWRRVARMPMFWPMGRL